ncbi:MAG: OsmC family protein [Fimbriimonadaceae bacterium]
MAKLHEYPVTVAWTGAREGQGTASADRTGVEVPLRVPPEFGGSDGAGTNPEELLAASVASCYTITFGIIAGMRKLPVVDVSTKAVGLVEENGPQFTYKKLTLMPRIVLAAGASDDEMKMAEDMSHKADAYCIITNAVRGSVEIVVEPTIERG